MGDSRSGDSCSGGSGTGLHGAQGRWRGWLSLVAAVLLVIGYVVSVRQVDLEVFLRAGHDVLAGRNPYPPLRSPLLRANAAYVYPIVVAYAFAPLAAVPGSVVIFDLLSGAALLGALRVLGVRDPVVTALALLATPALIGLQDGTLNAVLLLCVAAAWRWRERPLVAGLLVAAAVVAKVFLWPLLLWLLLARRYRAFAVALLAGGSAGGLGFLWGPLSLSGYRRLLTVLSQIEAPHARSVAGLLLGLGAGFAVATGVSLAVAALLLGDVGWRHRVGKVGEVGVVAAALVASLLASPVVWEHYYVLLLVPLLLCDQSVRSLLAVAAGSWAVSTPGGSGPAAALVDLGAILAIALVCHARWTPGLAEGLRRVPWGPTGLGLVTVAAFVVPASDRGSAVGAVLPVTASLGLCCFAARAEPSSVGRQT